MRLWIALCAAALAAAGTSFDARQPQAHARDACRARLPDRAERIVDYRIGVKLDHATRQLHRPAAAHLAQSVQRHGPGPVVPPVPERVQEPEHARFSRNRADSCAARPRAGQLGMDSGQFAEARGRHRSHRRDAIRAAGRSETRGPDGDARAAPDAGAARRHGDARLRLHGTAAAGVRADRLRRRLLPGRPVVPEDRGLRAGRQARPEDRRLELPPVPRALGVLRRLRTLSSSR